jgi:Tfp pilus assembly protein PilN
MIRINLLEQISREAQSMPSEPASPAAFQARALLGGLAVSALLVLGAHWLFSQRVQRLNQQTEVEQREAARLSVIQAANSRYSSELQEINRRIDVLQILQNGRRGPSQLMTELAAAVNGAPNLYLISVTPQGGRLALTGASTSTNAIATLVRSLQGADGFGDVQLREYYEDDQKDGRVSFRFSLDFSYAAPATPRTADAAPAAPPGAPGARAAHGT